jgi:isocitrate dehydrogenase
MGDIIQFKNGQLVVPDQPVIPFIEGDGIGKDITGPSQMVIDAAVKAAYGDSRKLIWKELLAGKKAFELTGSYMPDETLEAFQKYLVGIKGPLETPVGDGIRSLNVALRQTFDLYVSMRPIRWFKGVPSPIRYPELVDMHIFRENTEDIYAGIEFMTGTDYATRFRDFLDSRHGRHFADDVANGLCTGEPLAAAIDATIARWMGWRIDRKTSRDEGIPVGLPYLTGRVTHVQILDEMQA